MMDDEQCLRARGLLYTAEINISQAGDKFGDGTEDQSVIELLDAMGCLDEALLMVCTSGGLLPSDILKFAAPLVAKLRVTYTLLLAAGGVAPPE